MKRLLSLLLSAVMFICAILGTCLSVYAGEPVFGIDVSEHNDLVNFADAKNNNKDFVMIRLGYYNHLDEKFWDNVKNAYNAKMDFGVYLYSYAYSTAEAQIEANFVVDTLSQMGNYAKYFTLPVAYDLEEPVMAEKCTKTQITTQMTTFCDTIKNAGYVPMVYANLNWYTNYIDINTAVSKGYKIWYANWTISNPNFSSQITVGSTGVKADMWQYINGEKQSDSLDKNVIYDSETLVQPLSCYHSYTSKKVAATCKAQGYTLHTCANCSNSYKTDYVSKADHKWVLISADAKATASKDGSGTYECSVCGSTKTDIIPKIASAVLNTTATYYSGSVKTPIVTVKDSAGKTLVRDTDYTVTQASGRVNVGRYAVKVTYKGNYSGSKTLYFNIIPKGTSISGFVPKTNGFTVQWTKQSTQTTGYQIQYSKSSNFSSATTITMPKNTYYAKSITGLTKNTKYYVRIRTYAVTKFNGENYNIYSGWSAASTVSTITTTAKLSTTSTYYTGSVITPTVTVKDSAGKTLKKGTDYSLTYASGRKNVGRYSVKVTYKGNYAYVPAQTLYFNIVPKGVSSVKVAAKSKGFAVSWTRQTTQTTGYQIQYSTSSTFTNASTITMPKNTYYAKSVTGRLANKKYYVRVRTYKVTQFNGKDYNIYSPWSAAKSVTTLK